MLLGRAETKDQSQPKHCAKQARSGRPSHEPLTEQQSRQTLADILASSAGKSRMKVRPDALSGPHFMMLTTSGAVQLHKSTVPARWCASLGPAEEELLCSGSSDCQREAILRVLQEASPAAAAAPEQALIRVQQDPERVTVHVTKLLLGHAVDQLLVAAFALGAPGGSRAFTSSTVSAAI